jgi:integrase/recombinase XerD
MIERYFDKSHVRRRLRRGPLAAVVQKYLRHLDERGYSKFTIQQYVQAAEHFANWLVTKQRIVQSANDAWVAEFLEVHLPRCSCAIPRCRTPVTVRAALHQLLETVGVDRGARSATNALCPLEMAIGKFESYLVNIRGLAQATRTYCVAEVRLLLIMKFKNGPIKLESFTPGDMRDFMKTRTLNRSPGSANQIATAIRSFVRYLCLLGVASDAWKAAVPRAACWRLAHLPRVLTVEEVAAFLAAFDQSCPQGKRDYAIALCLLQLGLRAAEVAALKLEDVSWRESVLTISPGKSRRGARLPLPASVARALADYLRRGRPKTPERTLFVHHRAPRGRAIEPTTVRSAVRLAYARAGLDPKLTGTHVLRHTAATRMLRAGVSMKEIADLLRHRSLDTSAIYAKVDIDALTGVALPWPEVRP